MSRLAASFFDDVEVVGPQEFGDLARLGIAAQQHTAGHGALADSQLVEDFRQAFQALVPIPDDFHPCLATFGRLEQGVGGNMILPVPAVRGVAKQLMKGDHIPADAVHQRQDLRAGTPGFGHRRDFQSTAIAADDFIEQSDIPAAPGVDCLLAVTDDEQRAVVGGGGFIDERQQAGPIGAAGVLEFV